VRKEVSILLLGPFNEWVAHPVRQCKAKSLRIGSLARRGLDCFCRSCSGCGCCLQLRALIFQCIDFKSDLCLALVQLDEAGIDLCNGLGSLGRGSLLRCCRFSSRLHRFGECFLGRNSSLWRYSFCHGVNSFSRSGFCQGGCSFRGRFFCSCHLLIFLLVSSANSFSEAQIHSRLLFASALIILDMRA
jgi:hypothetical protein